MLCPVCHRWEHKELWSPAQWKSSKPILLDLQRNCCARCSSNHWAAHTPVPTLARETIDDLRQHMMAVASMINRPRAESFMKAWMYMLGKSYRKDMSHHGVLKWREYYTDINNAKGLWTNPATGERFHDPGNYIYARAFHLAFPGLGASAGWSQETMGDIFEALLGLVIADDMCGQEGRLGHPRYSKTAPQRLLAGWVDEFAHAVWVVSSLRPSSCSDPRAWAALYRGAPVIAD
jgi:hypothetical protein